MINSYVLSTDVKVLFTWAIITNRLYGNNCYVVSTGVKVLFTWVIIANHLNGNNSDVVSIRVKSINYLGYDSQQLVWEQLLCHIH